MDLFTTFLSMSGLDIPNDRTFDGVDLSGPLIEGLSFERPVFFYRGDLLFAVRMGPYKMHLWTWTTPQSELDKVSFITTNNKNNNKNNNTNEKQKQPFSFSTHLNFLTTLFKKIILLSLQRNSKRF